MPSLSDTLRQWVGSTDLGDLSAELIANKGSAMVAPVPAAWSAFQAPSGEKVEAWKSALDANTYQPKHQPARDLAGFVERHTPDVVAEGLKNYEQWREENPIKGIGAEVLLSKFRLPDVAHQRSDMFHGARTDEQLAASRLAAKRLEDGENPSRVWAETGWGRLPGTSKMVTEISDKGMSLVGLPGDTPARLEQIIHHPEYFRTFPEDASIKVKGVPGRGGLWDKSINTMNVGTEDPRNIKSITSHELQHSLQDRFRHPGGGNDEYLADMADKGMTDLFPQLQAAIDHEGIIESPGMLAHYLREGSPVPVKSQALMDGLKEYNRLHKIASDPIKAYRNIHGEAMARLVQARLGFNKQQGRDYYPFEEGRFKHMTGSSLDDLTDPYGNLLQ